MKNILILLAVLVLPASYFFYQTSTLQKNLGTNEVHGEMIPNFNMITMNNEPVTSKSLAQAGKKFFVHIWGTWCGPCQTEFPVLLNYAAQNESKDVIFYLVATNDSIATVSKYLQQYKDLPKNVKILIDPTNAVGAALKTNQVPETFLYKANGELINKYVGPQNWEMAYYKELI